MSFFFMPSRIPPDAGTDPCWECGIHICVCAGWSFSVQGQGIPAALRSLPEEDPVMASKRTALSSASGSRELHKAACCSGT